MEAVIFMFINTMCSLYYLSTSTTPVNKALYSSFFKPHENGHFIVPTPNLVQRMNITFSSSRLKFDEVPIHVLCTFVSIRRERVPDRHKRHHGKVRDQNEDRDERKCRYDRSPIHSSDGWR